MKRASETFETPSRYQHTHNESTRKRGERERGQKLIFEEIISENYPSFILKSLIHTSKDLREFLAR